MQPVGLSVFFSEPDHTAMMKAYIRENFAALLGDHVGLLDEPNGLDRLAALIRAGEIAAERLR